MRGDLLSMWSERGEYLLYYFGSQSFGNHNNFCSQSYRTQDFASIELLFLLGGWVLIRTVCRAERIAICIKLKAIVVMNEWAGVAEFRKLKMRNDIEIDTVKVVVHGMWVEWYDAQVDCSVCLHFILIVINWKSIGFYDHTFSVVCSSSHLNHVIMWNLCFRKFVSALILCYCIHGGICELNDTRKWTVPFVCISF